MDADVAFVEVGYDRAWLCGGGCSGGSGGRAGVFGGVDTVRVDGIFTDEEGDAGALGFVVLPGDVEDVGANHLAGFAQDLREAVGVVFFIDIGDISIFIAVFLRVANIINAQAQAFGEVVESVELDFLHGCTSFQVLGCSASKVY